MQKEADVAIIGGGIVGLAFACALAQQTPLSIILLEANSQNKCWSIDQYDYRVSAISLCTQRILKSLNVWEKIATRRISPFKRIEIFEFDEKSYLTFDSQEINESALGFIVENNLLHHVLTEKLQQFASIKTIHGVELSHCVPSNGYVEIKTNHEDSYKVKLIVGADGAHSWLRSQANIDFDFKSYQQKAIVTNVKTQHAHQNIARQIFLSTGPLAFLPLAMPNLSSIVWTLPTEQAEETVQLSEDEFVKQLHVNFPFLGNIIDVTPRFTFPLVKQTAKHYIAERMALIGDAAHVVHPMAGQGANLGILDMASLAEIIETALRSHQDFGATNVLRRYERWRKADNLAMTTGIDFLKNLFAYDNKFVSNARRLGMLLTSQSTSIKKFLTLQAVGNRNGLPKIACKI